MKSLYKTKLSGPIIEMLVDEKSTFGSVTFKTEKESVSLGSEHEQDCCENVYADFSGLKYHADEIKGNFSYFLEILAVDGIGFLIILGKKKFFIPCYNEQNGYYSSDLSLVINNDGVKTYVDIRSLTECDQ